LFGEDGNKWYNIYIWDGESMSVKKWLNKNTKNLENKTVAISGATGGIGKNICEILVGLNANLILLDRNMEKSLALKKHLLEINKKVDIKNLKVDMSDFESVKAVTEELKKMNIDVLLLNAGAYKIPRKITSIGYDNVFQINFISPYYMIKQLLPNLREKEDSHVVVVGSVAHNYSHINENDIDFRNNPKCTKVYGNSKRFLMFGLYELFKNEDKVKLAVSHPGITSTNITAHYPKLLYAIIKYPMKVIFMSNKKASLSIVKGVFEGTEYHTWWGPRAFNVWGFPKKSKLKTCKKEESQKIFEISEKIYDEIIKK